MMKLEILIVVTFAALVCCTEVEDGEQKKRGAGKATSLNSIPTGAQKPDYNTYSIYSSNPNVQSSSNPTSYQSQVPNSFYPSQTSSQYYSSPNTQSDTSSYVPQQQPQINLLPPPSTSQFVPLNFVPNPGYQTKYQLVPTKSNGNFQLAFYQQPGGYPSAPIVPYSPQLFSQNPSTQISSPQTFNIPQSQGQFNAAPNYPQLPFGGSYLGQPSTMLLFAQPPNVNQPYSNLLYNNPVPSFYNYYPTSAQNKYNVQYVPQTPSNDYEKLQSSATQNVPKEENDIAHGSEYPSPSESSTSYKTAYPTSRNSYTKL